MAIRMFVSGCQEVTKTTKSDRVAQQHKNQYNNIIGTFQNVPTVQVKFSNLTQTECNTKEIISGSDPTVSVFSCRFFSELASAQI